MYIKIVDGQIEKYPYSVGRLKAENPNTSFPENISDEVLAEFNVQKLKQTQQPSITYKQNIIEDTPIFDGNNWVQVWNVTDKEQEEIDRLNERLRAEAYRNEADPLFFKHQRDEIDKQVWLDKVAEIKARYS